MTVLGLMGPVESQFRSTLRPSRSYQNVAESTVTCSLKGGLGKLLSSGKVHARKIDLLETSHNLHPEKFRLDLPHHLDQGIIVIFDVGDFKPSLLQNRNVSICRQRITDASNPGEQPFKLWNCCLGSSQVTESQLSAWLAHTKELLRCNPLAGKCAESTLPDDRIKSFIIKWQPLCIAELKADLFCQTALRRIRRGQMNVLFAQINASNLAAK